MVTPRSQMRSRSGLRTKEDPMFRQPRLKMVGEAEYAESLRTGARFAYPRNSYISESKMSENIKKLGSPKLGF